VATADELAYQLKDSGARYLLTAPEQMERATRATQQVPMRAIFTVVETSGATPFAALLTGTAEPPEPPINLSRDVAALLYSSGTTGLPKGVMLTHRNLIANICQLQPLMRVAEDDMVINAMPFFHAAGWVILFHMSLANGCTIVTLPRFELEAFLRAAQDYGVTRTSGVDDSDTSSGSRGSMRSCFFPSASTQPLGYRSTTSPRSRMMSRFCSRLS
jgi:acyl-CoA synthetase (AMP-forming)/AMP-acid ligase II